MIGKRPDGYHDIETVFYPVGLADILEIVPAQDGIFELKHTGLVIPGEEADNLCARAYKDLQAVFELPPVKIHLHKIIPMGSGLGGGSSDGAATIDRSLMNIPFVSPGKDLDAKFIKEAATAGFVELKGHRLVGGMRASIYNAMPVEGVRKLTSFMKKFEHENK